VVWFLNCMYNGCIKLSERKIFRTLNGSMAILNPLILRVRYPVVVDKYINNLPASHLWLTVCHFMIKAWWSSYVTPGLTYKNSTFCLHRTEWFLLQCKRTFIRVLKRLNWGNVHHPGRSITHMLTCNCYPGHT
jgi:hypothetical protein